MGYAKRRLMSCSNRQLCVCIWWCAK